jgi:hypothetical protein
MLLMELNVMMTTPALKLTPVNPEYVWEATVWSAPLLINATKWENVMSPVVNVCMLPWKMELVVMTKILALWPTLVKLVPALGLAKWNALLPPTLAIPRTCAPPTRENVKPPCSLKEPLAPMEMLALLEINATLLEPVWAAPDPLLTPLTSVHPTSKMPSVT